MTAYLAKTALLPTGWASDVLITVGADGSITDVQTGKSSDGATLLEGSVIPGMANLHSHAFQRAIAGLTERATGDRDSFWTWREIMYSFLEKVGPEDMEAIAAQLYVEMLKGGYTSVAEFHYVHHQQDGGAYADRALLSRHVIQAAKTAGIGITHMPVLYACSGFGGAAPTTGQKRFINTTAELLQIISTLQKDYAADPQVRVALALHSLRAVTPQMLKEAVSSLPAYMPVHIHIAEQMKEVNDCITWSGKRPVEWLLENAAVDSRWCLVHATHMTQKETEDLARTGAIAGLCPTTEANLGDGLFNLPLFLEKGGTIGIGSDSHISVNAAEELRLLEYGQRLQHQARSVIKTGAQPSVGAVLYNKALDGGQRATGRSVGQIAVGKRADLLVLDTENPSLLCKGGDYVLDAMIFACNANPVKHVVAGGQWVVRNFTHIHEGAVLEKYRKTLKKIM